MNKLRLTKWDVQFLLWNKVDRWKVWSISCIRPPVFGTKTIGIFRHLRTQPYRSLLASSFGWHEHSKRVRYRINVAHTLDIQGHLLSVDRGPLVNIASRATKSQEIYDSLRIHGTIVYLPTWMVDFYGCSCRQIQRSSHGSSGTGCLTWNSKSSPAFWQAQGADSIQP